MKTVLTALLGLLLFFGSSVSAQSRVRGLKPGASLPRVVVSNQSIAFGAVPAGGNASLSFQLRNKGGTTATIDALAFLQGPSGTSESYSLDLLGTTYVGGAGVVSYTISESLASGAGAQVDVSFAPTVEQLDDVRVRFTGNFPAVDVFLSGLGGHVGDPYLHVVIEGSEVVVDYDADGSEIIDLDGSFSHTHEPGFGIVGWTWEEGMTQLGTGPGLQTTATTGAHTYTLTIEDDNVPAHTLSDSITVDVVPAGAVPGVLGRLHDASASSATALLDAIPSSPDFGEVFVDYDHPTASAVGSSSFTQDVMLQLTANLAVTTAGTYDFTALGGVSRRLELDGLVVTGPQVLAVGSYELEARFALDTLADLPISLTYGLDGGAQQAFDPDSLTHDQSSLAPIINDLPTSGLDTGGNPVTISGLGFFPSASLTLHWGGQDLTEADFTSVTADTIQFVTPAGPPGPISVTVETPQGTSNLKSFLYQINGPVPIVFVNNRTLTVPQPTSAAWGPDGKLYVTARDGRLTVVGFDGNWVLNSFATHAGTSLLSNPDTLGIAFNPYDPPSPVRVYVAHSEHYAQGGMSPTGPVPYPGQISILEGPDFDTPIPYITGLPTSNHDHAVNGIEFDNNGDLLICLGSNTNAGVASPAHGYLPETPLSAALLKARTSDPSFDGTITHVETIGGLPNDDQLFGEAVDVDTGDVSVHAAGLRNPYDVHLATNGHIYATDNGPNTGFGPASTGPSSQDPDPYDTDELVLAEWGNYYGHPNRSRGRTDARQNVYYPSTSGASIPDTFAQAIGNLTPSADGLDEYRSDTFQGQMRGDLLAQKWGSNVRRIELSDDGRLVDNVSTLDPYAGGLSLITGPGGAILSLDFSSSKLRVLEPDDLSAFGLVVHDITPWRAPLAGGAKFVIGGVGFGSLVDTSVTIGGLPATLTSVTSKRIEGTVPAGASATAALLDVEVTVGGDIDLLTSAFLYLPGPGLALGRWEDRPPIPQALGEVAAAVVDGVLYVVGNNNTSTWAFDLENRVWLTNPPTRPFLGDHHGSEVFDGKWYLIGGLDGAENKVQIYDPTLNTWSTGTDAPWEAASPNTALINGLIYVASGITSGATTSQCGIYDPVLDTWSTMASMPDGRNHAASGTDGTLFYVFGGRKGGNFLQNGFDDVFIYDPGTNTWDWTGAMGSTIAPLPFARGGMGKAVFLRDEFYVFGGETLSGPGAVPGTGIFDRVDVYDPVANTWRIDRNMPNPRHGVFPVLYQGLIYLPGGGLMSGSGWSTVFDVFNRQ